MHISIAAEPIFTIGSFNVTNSFMSSVITSLILMVVAISISVIVKIRPGRFQAVIEEFLIFILDLAESNGGKAARKFVPLTLTMFFFILLSNWIGLLPGFGSILINKLEHGEMESIPLFRGATADLNTTLALALVAFFSIQFYGISKSKLGYFKKFIDFSNPLNFFVGILELISEFAKIISFSFRLFGNVFAGEVLLAVMIGLVPFLVPLPFLGLEVFVGFIQALVFAMLTMIFIQLAISQHGAEEGSSEHSKEVTKEIEGLKAEKAVGI